MPSPITKIAIGTNGKDPLDFYASILPETQKMRRRIEIVAVEQIRIVAGTRAPGACPVCGKIAELMTTAQSAAPGDLTAETILVWIANELASALESSVVDIDASQEAKNEK